MTPKKTKSGSYHVTAYIGKVNGKPKYKSITAPTKRECMLKASEYINHHPKSMNDYTIQTAAENYIEAKSKVLSPSTIRGYQQIYNCYLPPLYDIRLSDFETYDFQKFVSSLEVSPKTTRNICQFLKSSIGMFSDKTYKISLPDKITPKRTVATAQDIKRLLEAADPELKKAIILGSCSLRRGEVAALKYEDISGTTLHVHADIVCNTDYEFVYKETAKTATSTRYVEVSEDIIKALGTGTGFIVKVKNPDHITHRFTALRDRLGINVSFHSLRRFYASISHALGLPNQYIMEQGGWKSESTMINSYRHTLKDQEKKYNDKLSKEFKKIIV